MKTLRIEKRAFKLPGGGVLYALVAADPFSEEMLNELSMDKPYKIDLKSDRSRGKLNEYWAGLALLHKNLSDEEEALWPTVRKLHNALLDAFGYTTREYKIDGSYRTVVDSVAMDNMDEQEFVDLFERVASLVVKRWGYDPWEAWKRLKDDEAARRRAQMGGWSNR